MREGLPRGLEVIRRRPIASPDLAHQPSPDLAHQSNRELVPVVEQDADVLEQKLRTLQQTRAGREALRERVGVEHRLAHLANRQGPKARYRGTHRNTNARRSAASVASRVEMMCSRTNCSMRPFKSSMVGVFMHQPVACTAAEAQPLP